MNYNEAVEKLNKHGQMQLLAFYDELSDERKQKLLSEIEAIDFTAIEKEEPETDRSNISPIRALTVEEIDANKDAYYKTGIKAIKDGKLACVLLAGGQGTRLGFDGPKGALNVGLTKEIYLFQMLIETFKKVTDEAGRPVHLYIMTSDKNNDYTVAFFEEHDYFGYDRDYVHFFIQEMAPTTDFNRKVLLEEKDHISLSPNGNGGWLRSLKVQGIYDEIRKSGVEWINVFGVDNGLQKIADPYFLGAMILSGKPEGTKVIKKAFPEERVGVMCYRNGRPSIVEYYDLTDELMNAKDEHGEPAYNFGVILNYLFSLDALDDICRKELPLHVVEKKIPCIDAEGNHIKPDKPNGYKYENLVLDMVEMMDDCLVYEIIREKEFAPIKNAHGIDSLDSARELFIKNNIDL